MESERVARKGDRVRAGGREFVADKELRDFEGVWGIIGEDDEGRRKMLFNHQYEIVDTHQLASLAASFARLSKRVGELEAGVNAVDDDLADAVAVGDALETYASEMNDRLADIEQRLDTLEGGAIDRPTRAEVVRQARADVEALSRKGVEEVRQWAFAPRYEFIVNREKRTVVALLKGGTVFARGKAKCAPNDVFNEDIGKAIAIHRAEGLDAPAEYLRAPKPDGLAVGDVIHLVNTGDLLTVSPDNMAQAASQLRNGIVKIIDDSDREEYRQ